MMSAGLDVSPRRVVAAAGRSLAIVVGLTGLVAGSALAWREWRSSEATRRDLRVANAAPVLDAGRTDLGLRPAPIPRGIELASSPTACDASRPAVAGEPGPRYPTVTGTVDDDVVEAAWSLGESPLGTAVAAPFVPLDPTGVPVALPDDLPVEPVALTAVLTRADGTTETLTTSIGGPTAPLEPTALRWRDADDIVHDLRPWTFGRGVGLFVDNTGASMDVALDGDVIAAGTPVDLDRLFIGPHSVVSPATTDTVTIVTTRGEPAPEPCSIVDITRYGAVPDDGLDDSGGVSDAIAVAVAAAAVVHVPAGVFQINTLDGVPIERGLEMVGEPGAVLDAGRPHEKYTMLDVDANVTIRGLEIRSAGRFLAFDHLSADIDRVTIDASTFRDLYSPAHLSDPPTGSVRVITITGTTVVGATKGYLLPLTRFDHARVSGNTFSDVDTAAIRLGADFDETFATQLDADVRGNTITGVGGPSDANGIKIMGTGGVIVDNDVRSVQSDDLSDSEGIYTKGSGHLIARNVLVDAGATQAQITVKSDNTRIVDNSITTVTAPTNGIRIEGSNIVVSGNRIVGGGPDSFAITTKLVEGFGNFLIENNVISATAGTGISTGGDGPISIVGNTFDHVSGVAAIEVLTSRADTLGIVVRQNTADDLTHERSRFLALTARNQRVMSQVEVRDNTLGGAVNAIVFYRTVGASIEHVRLAHNSWGAIRSSSLLGDDQVDDLIVD